MIIGGSFFGGLFGIAFLELQTRKVDSADEVPTDLGLQVVGTLPILLSKAARGGGIIRRRNEVDRYWQNLMLESIDATRTMLIHAARTGSHRVVMITSAVGGEGKTSLASHLATSLARSGLRTLLIDADLRSPSIHRLFNLPVAAGLSEVLRGEVAWADAIAATTIEDLKVLTAGQCDRQTIGLLSQGGLGPLLRRAQGAIRFRDRRLIAHPSGGRWLDHCPVRRCGALLDLPRRESQDQGLGRGGTPSVPWVCRSSGQS